MRIGLFVSEQRGEAIFALVFPPPRAWFVAGVYPELVEGAPRNDPSYPLFNQSFTGTGRY